MAWNGAHGVVGDAGWNCAAQPGWVLEHDIEAAVAAVVEVEVDAAVVMQDKIADRVGALDIVWVGVEGLEEFRVELCDLGARVFVGPELLNGRS